MDAPCLPADSLARVGRSVSRLMASHGGVPHAVLMELVGVATGDASVRLDLRAADLVGCPVVVVTKGAVSSDAMLDQLSPRERQVARLIARGLSNKLLARTLGISLHTVKDHVHNILSKTGLANRAEVAARLGHGA